MSTMQPTLFDDPAAALELQDLTSALSRRELGDGAWVDLRPGWLTGTAALTDLLLAAVPWRAEERQMYDRKLPVPRLLAMYLAGDALPHPILGAARDALSGHYRGDVTDGFATAGLCLYRNGDDSVAWHGDTIGRGKTDNTVVAIISLGSARTLALRPRDSSGPRQSLRFTLGSGDLLVMGGSCQRTWEHAVPKAPGAAGPRISIQFRPEGVF